MHPLTEEPAERAQLEPTGTEGLATKWRAERGF